MRRGRPTGRARAVLTAAVLTASCSTYGAGSARTAGTTSGTTTTSITAAASSPVTTTSRATTSSTATSAAERTERCVRELVDGMSLTEAVGQLLMVGVPAEDPRDGTATVRRYHLGGVFLRGRTALTPQELRRRLDALQHSASTDGAPRLHVAVDQEGGLVRNLRGEGFAQLPSARTQAGWDDATLRRRTAAAAAELHRAGVTVNLAPVADTVPADVDDDNPPIGALGRQYGSSPKRVADAVRVVVGATQGATVLATLKHFPGLGRVTANTDFSSRAVDRRATTSDRYLEPFRTGIDAGAGLVMVSSARYPRIDPDDVAAFSRPVVTGLLRDKIGYDGVVVSDDLGNAVAVRSVPVGARAIRFVEAGGDLVLTVRIGDAREMSRALVARASSDPGFRTAVEASARRVLGSKVRVGLVPCGA